LQSEEMNAWKVQWRLEGKRLTKTFEGEKPSESGALQFAKDLRNRGASDVILISKRRAFAPPAGQRPPAVGYLWCPYCVKWREFDTFSIQLDGIIGPARYRCTMCTISVEDYWVKKYNSGRIRHKELEEEVKASVVRAMKPRRATGFQRERRTTRRTRR
jgi:hypothetical protein